MSVDDPLYNSMASSDGNLSQMDTISSTMVGMGGRAPSLMQSAATTTTTMTVTEVLPAIEGEVLRLTLRARPTVRWDENVEDNEGMGRKSSKRCCIFHKQREFGESSTDSSADENDRSEDDDDDSSSKDKKPKATNHERRKIARPKQKSSDVPDFQRFHA